VISAAGCTAAVKPARPALSDPALRPAGDRAGACSLTVNAGARQADLSVGTRLERPRGALRERGCSAFYDFHLEAGDQGRSLNPVFPACRRHRGPGTRAGASQLPMEPFSRSAPRQVPALMS